MSTSFYWEGDPCPCCGNRVEFEIGSSAVGWQFIFRAYDDIQSYRGMLDFLEENEGAGRIVDEYGNEHTLEALRRRIENKQRPDLRSHIDEFPANGFKDEEGYNFTGFRAREGEEI